MAIFRQFWNSVGLQQKLQILIQGFLILLLLLAQRWLDHQFEAAAFPPRTIAPRSPRTA